MNAAGRKEPFSPASLSEAYTVRRLEEADGKALLALCLGNPLYYRHCPPEPAPESLRGDMAALPPGKGPEDKYYLGYFCGERLAAVLDLILGYPNDQTAFIGFFMMERSLQGAGAGTAVVRELAAALRRQGFRSIRLGWAKGNPQSEHFWKKNGFRETGVTYDTGAYTVVVAQREIG